MILLSLSTSKKKLFELCAVIHTHTLESWAMDIQSVWMIRIEPCSTENRILWNREIDRSRTSLIDFGPWRQRDFVIRLSVDLALECCAQCVCLDSDLWTFLSLLFDEEPSKLTECLRYLLAVPYQVVKSERVTDRYTILLNSNLSPSSLYTICHVCAWMMSDDAEARQRGEGE